MKTLVVTLYLGATVAAFCQPVSPEPAPAQADPALSPEVVRELNARLPKFKPAAARTPANPFGRASDIRQQSIDRAPASQTETTPADPEVLELPKMTVKQQPKPRPRLNATDTRAVILGPQAFNEELARKTTSGFDRALNKFNLLGGQSAADRAREEYNIEQKRQFLDDVLTISKAAEVADPENAKALRDAAGKP